VRPETGPSEGIGATVDEAATGGAATGAAGTAAGSGEGAARAIGGALEGVQPRASEARRGSARRVT